MALGCVATRLKLRGALEVQVGVLPFATMFDGKVVLESEKSAAEPVLRARVAVDAGLTGDIPTPTAAIVAPDVMPLV